jgi:hypothetical protein
VVSFPVERAPGTDRIGGFVGSKDGLNAVKDKKKSYRVGNRTLARLRCAQVANTLSAVRLYRFDRGFDDGENSCCGPLNQDR